MIVMLSSEIVIINKLGLHARAAAKLVACASDYSCQIEIEKDNRRVNAKSIMGVMMLAASKGSQISLHIEGEDETLAMQALTQLINDRFGESE
jgi:phosphocarrier protein HPr